VIRNQLAVDHDRTIRFDVWVPEAHIAGGNLLALIVVPRGTTNDPPVGQELAMKLLAQRQLQLVRIRGGRNLLAGGVRSLSDDTSECQGQ